MKKIGFTGEQLVVASSLSFDSAADVTFLLYRQQMMDLNAGAHVSPEVMLVRKSCLSVRKRDFDMLLSEESFLFSSRSSNP